MTLLYPLGAWFCLRHSGCGIGIFFLVIALQVFLAAAGQAPNAFTTMLLISSVLAIPCAAYVAGSSIRTYLGKQVAVSEGVLVAFALLWVLGSGFFTEYLDHVLTAVHTGSLAIAGFSYVQLFGKILWAGAGGAAFLLLIVAVFELALSWWGDAVPLRLAEVGRSLCVLLLVALGAMSVDLLGDFVLEALSPTGIV